MRPAACLAPVSVALLTAAASLALAPVEPAVATESLQASDALSRAAAPRSPSRLNVPVVSDEVRYSVAPGLSFRQWTQTDASGPVRLSLLVADLDEPTLRFGYASMVRVRQRAVLTTMLARSSAVAGVNANYFDIHDTGAPRGVGIEHGRVVHGARPGWVSFLLFGDRTARIREAAVRFAVIGRPEIKVTDLNSPFIPRHGIGIYTSRWGNAAGYHLVDSARRRYRGVDDACRRDVRQVVLRHRRVVSNSRRLTIGQPVVGQLLVGRGRGAASLRPLKVGQRVRITWSVKGDPTLVVSGSRRLLAGGSVTVTDNSVSPALWPDRPRQPRARTAVGIDRDTGDVLLLVVDGRQVASRGMTLLQLAGQLRDLGAEDGLNLDGGGSSTMVSRNTEGEVGVVNSPSDGQPRRIATGLALVSSAPAG